MPKPMNVTWVDKADYALIQQDLWRRLARFQREDVSLLQQITKLKQELKQQTELVKALRNGRVMRLMIATQEFCRRVQGKTI